MSTQINSNQVNVFCFIVEKPNKEISHFAIIASTLDVALKAAKEKVSSEQLGTLIGFNDYNTAKLQLKMMEELIKEHGLVPVF